MSPALLTTDLPFPVRRGKVRDVYDIGEALLIVATDRISAFDVVMDDGVPGKGELLTGLSAFWFAKFANEFPNHVLETDANRYPDSLRPFEAILRGRSMLVKKAQVVPIECVARGYLAGSGWKEYQQSQTVCGVRLPAGLRQCERLPEPIFTPATKEEHGHDVNIDFAAAEVRVGRSLAAAMREQTLALYAAAAAYALQRGIIIADTKFEFGTLPDGQLILIDEVLTPDSSRFWPADGYVPGHDQPSFDKQFLRNWLEQQPWNKSPPPPRLPADVIKGTRDRYADVFQRLTAQPPVARDEPL